MDIGYIFMFLGISFLSSVNCMTSTIGMIVQIGTNSRYYPMRYVAPARWVKSVFNLKQNLIPRYLYFELVLSLIFAVLGPINLIICVVVDCALDVVGVLVMFHICLVILNMAFFSIMSSIFKRQ